ncbi:cation:proton antiporter subunit C [Acidobacteriota bacterium]
MEEILSTLTSHVNYWGFIILMLIGLYAVISKNNLAKKIIGLNIFQTAIIFFFISTAAKRGATIPIIRHAHEHHDEAHAAIKATEYMNPLPHVLMLTAIVVSVATLGVALALAIKVYRQYRTLEEDEINDQIRGQ